MLYFNDINKERLEILRQVFQDDDEDDTKNIVLNIEEKDFWNTILVLNLT